MFAKTSYLVQQLCLSPAGMTNSHLTSQKLWRGGLPVTSMRFRSRSLTLQVIPTHITQMYQQQRLPQQHGKPMFGTIEIAVSTCNAVPAHMQLCKHPQCNVCSHTSEVHVAVPGSVKSVLLRVITADSGWFHPAGQIQGDLLPC